ncbi:MAG: hypothetical protein K5864_07070 [Bacteroidales bacterium]|nr:hypothetical protein [Bacteroidales bacterium]
MEYNIDIKKGLGDINFDMPIEDIVAIMGPPEEIETIDNACDEMTTVLHYNDGELTLFCEGDSPKLQCIDISVDETTLFGKAIFDMGEKEIVQLMIAANYFEEDADQEDWGERRITFPEGNIDFYFEDDDLISVAFGQ